MLNAGVLSFDEYGRVKTTGEAPAFFNGGTPTHNGKLCIGEVEPVSFNGGFAFGTEGRACVDQDINAESGGGLVNNLKGAARSSSDMPAYWHAGLPFTAAGQLSVRPLEPETAPPDAHANLNVTEVNDRVRRLGPPISPFPPLGTPKEA